MKTSLRCWLSITLCLYALGGHAATAQNAYEFGEAALRLENYEEAIEHFTSAEKNEKQFPIHRRSSMKIYREIEAQHLVQ